MAAKICPRCGLPADTKTGVHDFYTDCLDAKDKQIQALQATIDRQQVTIDRQARTLDKIDALADELAGIDARRAR